MTRTVFLVPRRNDGGHRDALWAWCRERWETLMPDVDIYEGHHTDGPFNRAAAINVAAALADRDGPWDIAVVIDSDVFLPIPHVRAAIDSAAEGKVTWAHRRWRGFAEADTTRALKLGDTFGPVPAEATDMDLPVEKTTSISWSCCVAIPRVTFDDMGGFDERFVGWGFEDGAWSALVRCLYPWARIEGDLYHLWHERSDERLILGQSRSLASNAYIRNALLGRRYMVAAIRDYAVGDRPGEEHLDPDVAALHIANLTRDDTKFLRLAAGRRMPEGIDWAEWWPSLEELREGARDNRGRTVEPEASITLIVRTGGTAETWAHRSEYLRRSIASLMERVSGPIVQRVVYSDWPEEFTPAIEAIVNPFGFYVAGGGHFGYTTSTRRLWRYIGGRALGRYVFLAEDDFTYERTLDLMPLVETLEQSPYLVQVALLRDAFYPREQGEGILGWPDKEFRRVAQGNGHGRLEHRLFWTMNPCLIRRSLVTREDWPTAGSNSEKVYGERLFRDADTRVAFWGDGSPWISHIGAVRAGAGY